MQPFSMPGAEQAFIQGQDVEVRRVGFPFASMADVSYAKQTRQNCLEFVNGFCGDREDAKLVGLAGNVLQSINQVLLNAQFLFEAAWSFLQLL